MFIIHISSFINLYIKSLSSLIVVVVQCYTMDDDVDEA